MTYEKRYFKCFIWSICIWSICPRIDAASDCYLYPKTSLSTVKNVIENVGRYPCFALLPLKWYTAEQATAMEYRVEVTMARLASDLSRSKICISSSSQEKVHIE